MTDKLEFMTISEMAKYRNVTTETLRHYDRIGLFKPEYIDPDTSYRYYAVGQHEKLGTIKELRQLGMSLDDIKSYFEDRTVKKSTELLKSHCDLLKQEIIEKQLLVKTLEAKLDFLAEVKNIPRNGKPFIRNLPERYMISDCEYHKSAKERARASIQLEEKIRSEQLAPIIASNRMGGCSDADFMKLKDNFEVAAMVMCDSSEMTEMLPEFHKLEAGEYLCFCYNGRFGQYLPLFEKAKRYIKKEGYEVGNMFYQIYQVDITLTNNFDESVIELQIPISKIK